jgi:tetratricopeptide (TPR) repeat protein
MALAILQGGSSPPTGADARFELARTDYLLGRGPDRQSTPGPSEGDRPRPPTPPREFERRRPGHRPPPRDDQLPPDPGGPRPNPGHPEELRRAIVILEPLVKEDSKNPAYRYLLAQCYREEAGPDSGPLPEIDKAEQLLKALVKDYPHVADYRFELADTYAMLDVRGLPPEDFPRAEQRLRAALEQSADLVDGHPYAPDYTNLHVHILHKLARILRDTPPDQRNGDIARMDEAGQLYQEAIRRQAALVKRFPEDVVDRFWLAMIRMSSAEFLLERRQPTEARNVLETAVKETEPFYRAHPAAASLREVLHDLYERLGEALERMDDDKAATEARQKAEKLGPSRPGPRNGHGPPDRRRPPPRGPGGPPPERDE